MVILEEEDPGYVNIWLCVALSVDSGRMRSAVCGEGDAGVAS